MNCLALVSERASKQLSVGYFAELFPIHHFFKVWQSSKAISWQSGVTEDMAALKIPSNGMSAYRSGSIRLPKIGLYLKLF